MLSALGLKAAQESWSVMEIETFYYPESRVCVRGGGKILTSADALFLPRQDARAIDDTDAFQDLIGQLGAHESERNST